MEVVFATTVVAAILPITYILYILIYNHYSNQYFQKNLPNLPVLDGQLPIIGHTHLVMGPRNWKLQQDGHKKDGKTYGFYLGNQRAISTIDLDFIKKFAVDEDHHDRLFALKVGLDEYETGCLFTCEDKQWRRIRRAIAPAFSKHKVMSPNVQAKIQSVIDKLIGSIEWRLEQARREKNVDFIVEDVDEHMHKYSLALTFTCFYRKDNLVDFYAKTEYWFTMVEQGTKLMRSRLVIFPLVFPILNPISKVILKFWHPLGKLQTQLLCFIKEQADLYRRASLELKKSNGALDEAKFTMKDGTVFKGNMIDHFIGKYLDNSITEREFYHSSSFLFMAADKTASDVQARLVYLLACHQEVQDKLRDSIRLDGIESVYLTWVINEALRLFPPAHIGCSRQLSQPVETRFGTIPKDTFVQTPVWTIHRWPEYWGEDADDFKPERFANSDKFHPLQFIPFGAGRKSCPGKEFALRETRMLLVELLQRFKFERSSKTTDALEFQAPFHLTTVNDFPIWIKISRL